MFSSISVSSCKLVAGKGPTSEEIVSLESKRSELIKAIEDDFADEYYFDEELHTLQLLRQECINLLNEETDVNEIDALYSRLRETLELITSKKDYFKKIFVLDEYLALVTKEDQYLVKEKYESVLDDVIKTVKPEDLAKFVNAMVEYITYVTSQGYLEDIKQLMNECYETLDQYLYYDFQVDDLNHIMSEYAQKINLSANYDTAEQYYEEACALLKAVQNKTQYDQKMCQEAKDYVRNSIESIKANAVFTNDQRTAFNSWAENVYAHIRFMSRAHDVLSYYINQCLQFIEDVGVDVEQNLDIQKELKLKQLECLYLNFLDYRKDDYADLLALFDTCKTNIMNAISGDALNESYQDSNTLLQTIKTNEEKIAIEDAAFEEEITSLCGENKIDRPANQYNVTYYYQFAEIIDYYLYYQKEDYSFVQDEFRVKVNFPFFDARSLRNDVYWFCSLMRGSADMYFVRDNDYFVVKLIGYEQGTKSIEFTPITKRNDPSYYDNGGASLVDRDNSFDDFAYKSFTKKAYCWNSQQLCYALENGYCPVVKPGSLAEQVLSKAKEILRDIIKEGMEPTEKMYQIYTWLGKNASLDMNISEYNYSTDMEERPSENLATLRSFYAESALFDGHTLCDGYAKAYGLMLNMEGIKSKRVLCKGGDKMYKNTINTSTLTGTGHHEVTFVEVDGNTYCSDPTRSSANTNRSLLSWNHILFPTQYVKERVMMKTNTTEDDGKDYKNYILSKLKIGSAKMLVRNKTELLNLISQLPEDMENSQFEILFTNEYKNCKNDFLDLGLDFEINEFYTDERIKGLIAYLEPSGD